MMVPRMRHRHYVTGWKRRMRESASSIKRTAGLPLHGISDYSRLGENMGFVDSDDYVDADMRAAGGQSKRPECP